MTKIVVTNGFHYSRKLAVKSSPGVHFYEVESFIDNIQLLTGLVMALLFLLVYILSGIRFFMFFANVPLLAMIYIFYVKRNSFIQIHVIHPEKRESLN